MKHRMVILFLLAFHLAGAQTPYQDHFTGEVLRLDFLLAGGPFLLDLLQLGGDAAVAQ